MTASASQETAADGAAAPSPDLAPRIAYAVVGLVSAATVSGEVLATRILSVTGWYSLAFLVLSLAMVGLATGALSAQRASDRGDPLVPWLRVQLWRLGAGWVVAVGATTAIPLRTSLTPSDFAAILAIVAAVTWPLSTGAAILTRLLAEAPVPVARLYGIDLGCAALGALSPLVMLGPLSAPQALLVWAWAASLAAVGVSPAKANARLLVSPLVLMALIGLGSSSTRGFGVRYPKGAEVTAEPIFEAWNALSYVSAPPFDWSRRPRMWSPSPLAPDQPVQETLARIDGEAGTPIYAFQELSEVDDLRFEATAAAHALRPEGTACVIGVGGGKDLLAALLAGHDRVVGMEINPAIISMLEALRPVSPVLSDPRIEIREGDGRSLLAATPQRCRVLQASLVDTWAATSAGAFAHAESTLYTLEAWRLFLTRVEPDGILTFSRWYAPTQVSETSRLVSLGVAALLDRGVADPSAQLILLTAGSVATILVSPKPFTAADLDRLRHLVSERQFTLLAAPGLPPATPLLGALLRARSTVELEEAGAPDGLDTSAPTDDRPFFFQLAKPGLLLHSEVVQTAGVLQGNALAMRFVAMTLVAVLLLGLALLGPAVVREGAAALPSWRAGVYFSALGAGYMLAELALVQRLHLVLSHPARSLIVVLASMLAASGLGSLWSPRLLSDAKSVRLAAGGAALFLALLPYLVIRPLAAQTAGASLAVRALWCGSCAALVGLLLGTLFPSGLRHLSRPQGVPMAMALNGMSAVIGSVVGLLISVFFGISTTLVVAGAAYLVAALTSPVSWSPVPTKI